MGCLSFVMAGGHRARGDGRALCFSKKDSSKASWCTSHARLLLATIAQALT